MEKIINIIKNKPLYFLYRIKGAFVYFLIRLGFYKNIKKLDIGGGPKKNREFFNIDLGAESDLCMDLENKLFPFPNQSIDEAICISTINYFTKKRGEEIIKDLFRIMRPGGIVRFGTQDLELITQKYVNRDQDFFFQKNNSGSDRFTGETIGDKFNSWFYGYAVRKNKGCKFFYDYETLSLLFKRAGFSIIEKKKYLESRIHNIHDIDNRQDQMFFIEAIK